MNRLMACVAAAAFAAGGVFAAEAMLDEGAAKAQKYRARMAELTARMAELQKANKEEELKAAVLEIKMLQELMARGEDLQAADKEGAWKAQINKALERRVSFDFAETSLMDAVEFLRQVTNVTMIVQPTLANAKITINLRVADMAMRDALTWMCELADAQWAMRDQAIYIHAKKEPQKTKLEDVVVEREAAPPPKFIQKKGEDAARMRVKWAAGNEIEVNGAFMAEMPHVIQDLMEQFSHAADDGLLVYRMSKPVAAKLDPVKKLISEHAPGVAMHYDDVLGLLMVTGEPAQLRRASAILRETRPKPAAPPQEAATRPIKVQAGEPMKVEFLEKVIDKKRELDADQALKQREKLERKEKDKVDKLEKREREKADKVNDAANKLDF